MRFALNKRIPHSISVRIAVLFWLTFSVGLCAAFLFTYVQLNYSLEKSSKEVISAKFRETANLLTLHGVSGMERYFSNENHRILNSHYLIRVMSNEGETLFLKPSAQEKSSDSKSREDTPKVAHPETLLGWHTSVINGDDRYDLLTERVPPSFYLQVGDNNEDREEILNQILRVFAITGGIFVLLGGGLGLWYARNSMTPIRTLISTIHGIEKGDFSQRVALSDSRDELRDLGETFNRMIARIEKLVQVMRESLDNVAHDIRTPLTRIRAVAEDALLSGKSDTLRDALEDCAESASQISELADQLMSISEAEAGTLPLHYETCDVKTLLDDVAEIYEFVAHEKEISLHTLPIPERLIWSLDRKRIKQAVANLIDNAIKFSPSHTVISLSASSDAEHLYLSVEDQGSGIAEGDLARIWDRLFRGDKSRSTKGLGLGLSIVQGIVQAHGGKVDVHPAPERGVVFRISLPQKHF